MKRKISVLSSFIFIVLGCLILLGVSHYLRYKESYFFKDLFYAGKDDYDVLIFGTSHAHCAVDPNILWDEYGITSYNLASSGEPISLTLFSLRSALETTHPKVIILDAGGIKDDVGHDHVHTGEAHKTLDAVPLGRTKLDAINYLEKTDVIEQPFEFLSNIYTYHDRIYDLSRYDFEVGSSLGRGKDWTVTIDPKEAPVVDRETRAVIAGGDGVKDYEKIVKICKDNGISLIFTAMPSTAGYFKSHAALFNALSDYTKEQGFEVLDMDSDVAGIGIDYNYDFGGGSHLNIMGSGKVSRYLGNKLLGTHGIEDKRGVPGYEDWDKVRNKYVDEVLLYLGYEEDATRFLMMAGDSRLKKQVFIRNKDILSKVYGLDYELKYQGIDVVEAGDDILGEGKDMLIKVYDGRKGDALCLQKSFIFNKKKAFLTVTGDEAPKVNYFPEPND